MENDTTERSFRFQRTQRLLKPAEYRRLFRSRNRSRDAFFKVLVAANDKPVARLGISVSRRVAAQATIRNRIKRQIRESFRQQQGLLSGRDIVVIAQKPAAGEDNSALRQSLENHWNKVQKRCVV